ncbi:biotin/lipoyl-containing protein [Pseudoalteromonas sp. 3-MNA-CIBAN-0064]|uniref:biotin/lipoyl-containing protein n=1 Tax=unclassified Pseudoalteromonas TaxID=194690 RepID=UPI00331B2A6C|tara:strand:+ start:26872 stop:28056 length:1185 start_codon:yes stop_codon:yes gene_type:complete
MTDLDILATFMEATKEPGAFENHPIAQQGIEGQLLYLQGLALVMNADNDIHETEVEYLQILINSFSLDSSVLDDVIDFAKVPDKATIQAFVAYYRRKPLAQLFLFDALTMTRRNNQVHEKEMLLVNAMATQLEILKGTQQDILDLFCHIKNRNWQESALYFSCHLLNPDHFKHLLDYHRIEFEELMAETRKIQKSRLLEIIKLRTTDDTNFERTVWYRSEQVVTELTISHELVLPWLQLQLARGTIRVNNNNVYLKALLNSKPTEIITCPNLGEANFEVTNVLINSGDKIKENDQVYTVESDKTVLEITSNKGGTVESVFIKVGDYVNQGCGVFTLIKANNYEKEQMLFKLGDALFAYDQEACAFYLNELIYAQEPLPAGKLLDTFIDLLELTS